MTNNTTAAETLTLHELNLVERLRDANRDIFPSDRNGLIALIERLTSPRAAVTLTEEQRSTLESLACTSTPYECDVVRSILDTAPAAPVAEPMPDQNMELARMTRMFHAACADLGLVNEALGLDPDDGGAEPILDAIQKLKDERDQWADAGYAAQAVAAPVAEPAHCQCPACIDGATHASDCAVHNEPAYPNGPCNCGSAQAVAADGAATPSERAVIDMLIALARATFLALDDSEEVVGDDGPQHIIDSRNFDAVSDALDALNELPDDKPGYTLDAGGKAKWALRNLHARVSPTTSDKHKLAKVAFEAHFSVDIAQRRAESAGGYADPWLQAAWRGFRAGFAAVSPATAEPTDYAAIEREHFGDPDKRTGIYAPATADERHEDGLLTTEALISIIERHFDHDHPDGQRLVEMAQDVAASQHKQGEPATADELAAFLVWWTRDVPEELRRDWINRNEQFLREGKACEALARAWEGWQARASQAAAPAEAIDRYQAVCAAAYQLAGVVGAPLRFLDALSDAANGEPMSADEALNLLPVGLNEIDEVNRSASAPAEAREITMTVEDAMRIVMANWGDKDAIERVFRANVAPADAGEAVGVADSMPGTSGFTMACFEAAKVPIGTKLYAAANAGEAVASIANPLTPYGMLVRALRIVAGTTLMEMAIGMGVSPAFLSSLEFGRRPVTYDNAVFASGFFSDKGINDTLPALVHAAKESQGAQGGKGGEA
ncbi:helix-turn-helix domain-containing protein [Burkholderia glumae]|uniref:helix-turn-helix domain-containing protein n=1 Tax=Burkholderia glumae TaxID=337 RepID=UPI00214FD092|nr:helix-turn-helix transcriptional regulator [Burkholderia glumae]